MTEVEGDGVAGQKAAHERRQGGCLGFEQEMEMVVEKSPGVAIGLGATALCGFVKKGTTGVEFPVIFPLLKKPPGSFFLNGGRRTGLF